MKIIVQTNTDWVRALCSLYSNLASESLTVQTNRIFQCWQSQPVCSDLHFAEQTSICIFMGLASMKMDGSIIHRDKFNPPFISGELDKY